MSFILDAIAKSEQERQQQEMPKAQILALPVVNERQPRRLLPFLVIGALILNAILFTIWIGSDSSPGITRIEEASRAEQIDTIARVVTDSPELIQQQVPLSTAGNNSIVPDSASESSAETGPEIIHTAVEKSNKTPVITSKEPEELLSEPVASVIDEDTSGWIRVEPNTLLQNAREGLDAGNSELNGQNTGSEQPKVSRLYDLPEAVRDDLPTVKFSGHLYSSDPAASVVFLDNQRPVMQGQQIVDELLLHEITPTGVIVEFRGFLISVGVLQNWTLN